MNTSNSKQNKIVIDEILYVKDMYEVRDYVLFYVKENNKKEIGIIFDGKNISYGTIIDNEYHEMKNFKGKPNSLNTINNLLTSEYNNYYSVSNEKDGDVSSLETNVLIIQNVMITMADLTKIKIRFSDADIVRKIFEHISRMF